MYTSDCVWNCFAFVIALRWAIAFQAMTASGPTRTWVPADEADAGAVGDAAQALSTATATSITMGRSRVAIKDPLLALMRGRQASRNGLADGVAVGRQDIGRVELGTGGPGRRAMDVAEAAVDEPVAGDDRARRAVRALRIFERQRPGDDHHEDRARMRVPPGGLSRCEDRVLDEHPTPVRIGGSGDRLDRNVLDPVVGDQETQGCGAGRQLGWEEMGRVRHASRQDAPHETDDEREREPSHGLLLLRTGAAAFAVPRPCVVGALWVGERVQMRVLTADR